MNILVTGGAGCIGSELVKELLKKNDVVILDNMSSGKAEHIKEFSEMKNFEFIERDILDVGILDKATKNKDIVFHLAANPDIKFFEGEKTDKDLEQNTIATYNLLESMRK